MLFWLQFKKMGLVSRNYRQVQQMSTLPAANLLEQVIKMITPIHPFHKYLLGTCCMQGPILGTGDTTVNRKQIPAPSPPLPICPRAHTMLGDQ